MLRKWLYTLPFVLISFWFGYLTAEYYGTPNSLHFVFMAFYYPAALLGGIGGYLGWKVRKFIIANIVISVLIIPLGIFVMNAPHGAGIILAAILLGFVLWFSLGFWSSYPIGIFLKNWRTKE